MSKAKTGLPEGDGAGKALITGAGVLLYPFETASEEVGAPFDDVKPAGDRPAFFRSRAPPVIAAQGSMASIV